MEPLARPWSSPFEEVLEEGLGAALAVCQRFELARADTDDLLSLAATILVRRGERERVTVREFVVLVESLARLEWRRRRDALVDAVDETLRELVVEETEVRSGLEKVLERVEPRCRTLLQARYAGEPTSAPGKGGLVERCLRGFVRLLTRGVPAVSWRSVRDA